MKILTGLPNRQVGPVLAQFGAPATLGRRHRYHCKWGHSRPAGWPWGGCQRESHRPLSTPAINLAVPDAFQQPFRHLGTGIRMLFVQTAQQGFTNRLEDRIRQRQVQNTGNIVPADVDTADRQCFRGIQRGDKLRFAFSALTAAFERPGI